MPLRQLLLSTLVLGCAFDTRVPLDGGVSLITCAGATECPRGLACSAKLGLCYEPASITVDGGLSTLPCESRFDCPRPLTCATDFGFCVQADEVPVDVNGFTALTCESRAGCPPPLACAINLGRCVSTAQVGTDGGVSVLPCNTTSDCVGSLVCATGLRRCADPAGVVTNGGLSTLPCTGTSDCIGSLVCATGLGRCANPSGIATDGGISTLPCTSTSDCIGTLVCARSLGFCTDLGQLPIDDAGVSQVPCQFSDDCPAPLACSSRASRCVDTSRVQLPVIVQTRIVDTAGQPVTRRSGVAPFDTGRVLVELQLPPFALTARFRTTESSCVATTPTSWACPLTFSGPSGSEVITLVASDLRGPAITERLTVLIDAEPPRVVPGTETLTIVPAPANPFTQLGPSLTPTAVRQDSVARVSLLLDDPNTTSAEVFFGGTSMQLPFTRRVGQSFVFEGQLPATLPDGDVPLEVTAIDDVGNRLARQVLVVEPRLRRDVTPPPAPDVTTNDGLVVERVPFGDGTRTGAFVRMRLSPPSGLLVFREASTTPVVLTLRTSGGAVSGQVSTIDQERLLAQAVDEAGNASPEVQVRRFRLFVNPGRTANATHVATTSDLSTPARHEPPVAMPSLDAVDGFGLAVAPQPRWEQLHDGLDAGRVFASSNASLFEDTPRRRLLRFRSDQISQGLVSDVASGHRVLTNFSAPNGRYSGACHTSRRTCLVVGSPPTVPTGNAVLWLLDDQGARQLRVLAGPYASVTFDPRREVFLLAQGTQLTTLDDQGSPLSTAPGDCANPSEPCHVMATPAGLVSAQYSQFVWRGNDGGRSLVSTGPSVGLFGHLALDRSSLELIVVDQQVSVLRRDGGTSLLRNCAVGCEAAWDPLARSLATIDQQFSSSLNDAGGDRDSAPSTFDMFAWGIAEPNGFSLPSTPWWRYDERSGWTTAFLSPSSCPPPIDRPMQLGIPVDGGWASPCGRITSLTGAEAPIPGFPSGPWVLNLGSQFVFSNFLWREGGATFLTGLPVQPGIAIPPNRMLTSQYLYVIGADAGVRSDAVFLMGLPFQPSALPFFTTSVGLPFEGWVWDSIQPSQAVTLSRLTVQPDFRAEVVTAVPTGSEAPVFRSAPLIVPRAGGRFLLYGGTTGTGATLRRLTDLWALHGATRPTVHWSVNTSRFNVPLDGLVSVRVSTTLGASGAGPTVAPVELLAWDPWRASWQVVAALDGGTTGSGAFVPVSSTFDVAVSELPTGREPLSVDGLEAVIDYVK